jgi:hypothetical protein
MYYSDKQYLSKFALDPSFDDKNAVVFTGDLLDDFSLDDELYDEDDVELYDDELYIDEVDDEL